MVVDDVDDRLRRSCVGQPQVLVQRQDAAIDQAVDQFFAGQFEFPGAVDIDQDELAAGGQDDGQFAANAGAALRLEIQPAAQRQAVGEQSCALSTPGLRGICGCIALG